MEKLDQFIRRANNYIPMRIFGLLSISFGIVGDTIAYFMYPGYDLTKNAVSALCDGSGKYFFQTGIVFSGIFAFFWAIYLGNIFNSEEVGEKLQKISIPFAMISCISFIFLGFFCGTNIIIAYIHGISAVISWGSGFCYITLYNVSILRDSNFSKYIAYYGFFVSFILAILMVAFFLHLLPVLRPLMFLLPLLEWINTFTVILWYFIISIYMIYKKI
jgi:hypothetical protein